MIKSAILRFMPKGNRCDQDLRRFFFFFFFILNQAKTVESAFFFICKQYFFNIQGRLDLKTNANIFFQNQIDSFICWSRFKNLKINKPIRFKNQHYNYCIPCSKISRNSLLYNCVTSLTENQKKKKMSVKFASREKLTRNFGM